eukprot:COSAG04_NODE_5400_length_1630_cov_1.877204_2_plen_158_part_00
MPPLTLAASTRIPGNCAISSSEKSSTFCSRARLGRSGSRRRRRRRSPKTDLARTTTATPSHLQRKPDSPSKFIGLLGSRALRTPAGNGLVLTRRCVKAVRRPCIRCLSQASTIWLNDYETGTGTGWWQERVRPVPVDDVTPDSQSSGSGGMAQPPSA